MGGQTKVRTLEHLIPFPNLKVINSPAVGLGRRPQLLDGMATVHYGVVCRTTVLSSRLIENWYDYIKVREVCPCGWEDRSHAPPKTKAGNLSVAKIEEISISRFIEVSISKQITQASYTDEDWAKLTKWRKEGWTEEDQQRADKQWNDLYAEAKRLYATGCDPSAPEAQSLARRCKELIEQFTHGDVEMPLLIHNTLKVWRRTWGVTILLIPARLATR